MRKLRRGKHMVVTQSHRAGIFEAGFISRQCYSKNPCSLKTTCSFPINDVFLSAWKVDTKDLSEYFYPNCMYDHHRVIPFSWRHIALGKSIEIWKEKKKRKKRKVNKKIGLEIQLIENIHKRVMFYFPFAPCSHKIKSC